MRQVRIPPSKSIAHRAIILAALAAGESNLSPFPRSFDADATLRCIRALGAGWREEGENLIITGGLQESFSDRVAFSGTVPGEELPRGTVLDCGESGSTLRFLIPLALLFRQEICLTGQGRLFERPHTSFLEALSENGATFRQGEHALWVKGPICSGIYRIPGHISSQFVSGLLMTLPALAGDSEIHLTSPLESKSYVDLTLQAMRDFGIRAENLGYERFLIPGGQTYHNGQLTVESDFSGAAFFLVAGALGHPVECLGLNRNSLQGDREILDILTACGATVEYGKDGEMRALPGSLSGIAVDVKDIPDLVPPITALFCFCKGQSRIINAGRLRLKESDRLHALAAEFNRLGGKITEQEDGLLIEGIERLEGGEADSHNDHRIAMALAVASLKSKEPISIRGAECVGKSYPDFWEDFSGNTKEAGK